MIKIEKLTYRDLMENHGDPETPEGLQQIKSEIISVQVPFLLQPHNVKIVKCHKYVAKSYIDALEEILKYFGEKFIIENNLNRFSGCHVIRKTSNKRWWSIHSWGMAFDHLANLGPYGPPSLIPYHFINAFLKRGFGWGGNWRGKKDGMHISVTGT